jgi:tRNA G18 (ribose-2'-O)-methylase SpoU
MLRASLAAVAVSAVALLTKRRENIQAALRETLRAQAPIDSVGLPLRVVRKAETVICRRTGRLTIVIERSTNSQNYTAVLRTAEALGVQHVWLISPPGWQQNNHRRKKNRFEDDDKDWEIHVAYAKQAQKWLTIRVFKTSEECVQAMKEEGHTIWVTDLSQRAEVLQRRPSVPLPPLLALVIGTEATGASDFMLKSADRRVYIDLHGFADSLNLSVAAALSIYHIFLTYPEIVGSMAEAERQELRQQWYPSLARNAREAEIYQRAVINPPPPFVDLRRCDEHRVGYVHPKQRKQLVKSGIKAGTFA